MDQILPTVTPMPLNCSNGSATMKAEEFGMAIYFFLAFVLRFTIIFCKSGDHFLLPFTKALVPLLPRLPLDPKGRECEREREKELQRRETSKGTGFHPSPSNIQKFMECTIRSEQQQSS